MGAALLGFRDGNIWSSRVLGPCIFFASYELPIASATFLPSPASSILSDLARLQVPIPMRPDRINAHRHTPPFTNSFAVVAFSISCLHFTSPFSREKKAQYHPLHKLPPKKQLPRVSATLTTPNTFQCNVARMPLPTSLTLTYKFPAKTKKIPTIAPFFNNHHSPSNHHLINLNLRDRCSSIPDPLRLHPTHLIPRTFSPKNQSVYISNAVHLRTNLDTHPNPPLNHCPQICISHTPVAVR